MARPGAQSQRSRGVLRPKLASAMRSDVFGVLGTARRPGCYAARRRSMPPSRERILLWVPTAASFRVFRAESTRGDDRQDRTRSLVPLAKAGNPRPRFRAVKGSWPLARRVAFPTVWSLARWHGPCAICDRARWVVVSSWRRIRAARRPRRRRALELPRAPRGYGAARRAAASIAGTGGSAASRRARPARAVRERRRGNGRGER